MKMPLPHPGPDNLYLVDHVTLLRRSLHRLTGRDLLERDLSDVEAAEWLFDAPFVLLSHNRAADPILTYANRTALALFELSWEEMTQMPSRLTAKAPDRAERARLLEQVAARGYIDDYSGVRVSRTGKRFAIRHATVWTLSDADGEPRGQAATFAEWDPLYGAGFMPEASVHTVPCSTARWWCRAGAGAVSARYRGRSAAGPRRPRPLGYSCERAPHRRRRWQSRARGPDRSIDRRQTASSGAVLLAPPSGAPGLLVPSPITGALSAARL